MRSFDVEITTLRGEVLATTRTDRAGSGPAGADPIVFTNTADESIPTPLSDTREATASLSIEDPAAGTLYFEGGADGDGDTHQIGALGRMLRMYVKGSINPKFWGQIVIADWGAERVLVTAQDQSLRLKKHFARYGDDLVGPDEDNPVDSPLDYRTLVDLIAAAENIQDPTPSSGQDNYPPLGVDVVNGTIETVTTTADTIQVIRGENIWEKIQELSESRYGPDFELQPRDDLGVCQTDDDGNTWPFYCVLNSWDRRSIDRTTTTIFKYVTGASDNNLETPNWEPSGDPVRNAVTTIQQGTEGGTGIRVFGHDLTAWKDVGIFVDWSAPAGGNSKFSREALKDVANEEVRHYARPPNFFTLHLRAETLDPGDTLVPRCYDDYDVGDEVSILVQKGYFIFSGTVRITKITPRRADQAGNIKVEVECVPKVTAQDSVTVGDDD